MEHARQVLSQVARDPGPWTRQLVILRTIQTLSVLDLKTYCDLVYELGEYGTENREPSSPPSPGAWIRWLFFIS